MLLWYFWIYSFLGYLLEKGFAKVTGAKLQGRKCFLLFPLCPVYGLGMLAVLALPEALTWGILGIIVCGMAATAVEYGVHWFYDTFLGVRFWDYSKVFGNLRGRICLPFSLIWGGLTAAAVRWIHPAVERLAERTVPEVTYLCLLVFAADAVCSLLLLKVTGDPERLRADRA
jgi:uncharacterized membrane protein